MISPFADENRFSTLRQSRRRFTVSRQSRATLSDRRFGNPAICTIRLRVFVSKIGAERGQLYV